MERSQFFPKSLLSLTRVVLVCQNTTCRKQRSAEVLEAFRASPVAGVEIKGCGCLGQCGNGPMVLILPEQIWYSGVRPDEVLAIIERFLLDSRECHH
ncbi:MAG: (2Fe-2S) ferredoxin domain-containing protein [Cyanosarcina radialis HA8281-LM2]|nr:(2Fe-2S) ferredoxin domain-containing protein [Cyanosarcina radialis HA8281-LM2]